MIMNRYGYVSGNPISYYDPKGLKIVGSWGIPDYNLNIVPAINNSFFDSETGEINIDLYVYGSGEVDVSLTCTDTCTGETNSRTIVAEAEFESSVNALGLVTPCMVIGLVNKATSAKNFVTLGAAAGCTAGTVYGVASLAADMASAVEVELLTALAAAINKSATAVCNGDIN